MLGFASGFQPGLSLGKHSQLREPGSGGNNCAHNRGTTMTTGEPACGATCAAPLCHINPRKLSDQESCPICKLRAGNSLLNLLFRATVSDWLPSQKDVREKWVVFPGRCISGWSRISTVKRDEVYEGRMNQLIFLFLPEVWSQVECWFQRKRGENFRYLFSAKSGGKSTCWAESRSQLDFQVENQHFISELSSWAASLLIYFYMGGGLI